MSSGYLVGDEKSPAQLKKILAEGDTAKLLAQPVSVDCSHDVADLGGISVDRRTVFFDQTFVRDLKAGRIKIPGMTWEQLIRPPNGSLVRHEHSEKAIDDGDNPIDIYLPAHEFATCYEHEDVPDPERYEAALREPIKQCQARFIALGAKVNPPKTQWCGPQLDNPDKADLIVLRLMRAKGVTDAFKVSKGSVGYKKATGADQCKRCAHWMSKTEQDGGVLAMCEHICGLVRQNRVCRRFRKAV